MQSEDYTFLLRALMAMDFDEFGGYNRNIDASFFGAYTGDDDDDDDDESDYY